MLRRAVYPVAMRGSTEQRLSSDIVLHFLPCTLKSRQLHGTTASVFEEYLRLELSLKKGRAKRAQRRPARCRFSTLLQRESPKGWHPLGRSIGRRSVSGSRRNLTNWCTDIRDSANKKATHGSRWPYVTGHW